MTSVLALGSRVGVVTALLGLAWSPPATGQQGDVVVKPGHQIRLSIGPRGPTLVRSVLRVNAGEIWFQANEGDAEMSTSINSIRRLSIRFGDRPATAGGLRVGLKAGIVAGFVAGAAVTFAGNSVGGSPYWQRFLANSGIGIAVGAGGGMLAGALIGLSQREPVWAPVDPRRLKVVAATTLDVGWRVAY